MFKEINMSKPIYIYILTNKCFNKDDLVKIGYTDDVEKRIKDLSNTSVYSDFEVYATYEVSGDIKKPDQLIHDMIDYLAPNKRLNPKREFYEMYPWDAAMFLEKIARISNTMDKFKRYKDNDAGSALNDEQDTDYSIEKLFGTSGEVRELFNQLNGIIKDVSNNKVAAKATKNYVSFKKDRKHNVVCLWPKNGWVEVVLNAKLGTIHDENNIIYDISNRLWPAAQYAFRFDSSTDVEAAKRLIADTYKIQ